jgi:flagellar hook-associated protein FlgK
MTFGFGLEAGLRALTAARLGIQTAGNNVANANTPGYSRQRVDLSSSLPFTMGGGFQVGTGVDVTDISRIVDEGLGRRINLQMGMFGSAEVDQAHYAELESVFGEPDYGLSTNFSGFFGAINSAQSDPADRSLRGGMVQAGNTLAQGFNMVSSRFKNLSDNTFAEVSGLVRQVNEKAHRLADLNSQIVSLESSGHSANELRDSREQLIQDISKLMDTQAITRGSGSQDLLVGGHLLVSGNRVSDLSVGTNADGKTEVRVGSGTVVRLSEGRIAGLLAQQKKDVPQLQASLDALAHNFILQMNRLQTTGMPGTGPFQSLTSQYGAVDGNHDGVAGNELLSQAGLPFDVSNGDLYVAVTDRTTGAFERTRIHVDPASMTVQDLANQIDGVAHVSASVDPTGRLRINADAGFGFDFSPRLDPNPDSAGTFGGSSPSVGSASMGPFDLSGQTFPVSIAVTTGTSASPTVTNVTLNSSQFANPAAATTDELVSAINSGLGAAGTAVNVGGHLVIRSNSAGASSQLQLANVGAGTALSALGMTTTAVNGQDTAVAVQVEGTYTGTTNGGLVFMPQTDGTIGVTQNLRVGVYDTTGRLVTTINAGAGYTPGDPIDLGNGVRVSFGAGNVSSTGGNVFALDTIADSDNTDVLVALGMNPMFLGSNASDIAVNPDLSANPDLVATGLSGASGDAGNLMRMTGLRTTKLDDLGSSTIEGYYSNVVGDLGFKTAAAQQTLTSQNALLQQLQSQRDSVSGVNIDEEMVDMVRYQQAYDAAAKFISTVQSLADTLMNIGS